MAWAISIIVLSVWIIGVTMPYTLHGHIHLLLALAVAIPAASFFLLRPKQYAT